MDFPGNHLPPITDTVKTLTEVLEMAKRGEIRGVVLAAVAKEKGFISAITDECRDYPAVVSALTSYLGYKVNEVIEEKWRKS
jgi:hypothetical protein